MKNILELLKVIGLSFFTAWPMSLIFILPEYSCGKLIGLQKETCVDQINTEIFIYQITWLCLLFMVFMVYLIPHTSSNENDE